MAPNNGSDVDPLSFALRPPPGETEQQRESRLKREAEAKAISDAIDEELRLEREAVKRKRSSGGDVKLLLLGQAESGKSTLQKQFQLLYAPQSIEEERASWKSVVFLNIVRSVRTIIEALDIDAENGYESGGYLSDRTNDGNTRGRSTKKEERSAKAEVWAQQLTNLKLRLTPLLGIEDALAGKIAGNQPCVSTSYGAPLVRTGWQFTLRLGRKARRLQQENAGTSGGGAGYSLDDDESSIRRTSFSTVDSEMEGGDANARMIQASAEDITELWHHPAVRSMLRRRRVLKLEDSAEFFLDEIERIAAPHYLPSTDDILRARIQTLGVAEHVFQMNVGGRKDVTWRLFDVGGSRGQRHTWIPFFTDANAIIFLAPISAFDQYLEEDYKINRIDDSLQTFQQICCNPLLQHVHLVLLLNKTDILKAKLVAGIKVKKYITSFSNRPNEFHEVSQYFRAHFHQVHRKNNPDGKRVLYTHMTSVVDTKTTQSMIVNVRDSIFRGYLKDTSLV